MEENIEYETSGDKDQLDTEENLLEFESDRWPILIYIAMWRCIGFLFLFFLPPSIHTMLKVFDSKRILVFFCPTSKKNSLSTLFDSSSSFLFSNGWNTENDISCGISCDHIWCVTQKMPLVFSTLLQTEQILNEIIFRYPEACWSPWSMHILVVFECNFYLRA